MSEQGKPEPLPWMVDAGIELLEEHARNPGIIIGSRRHAEIIAQHYARAQSLLPPRNSPTYAERAAQMLDSLSAHGLLAIDDSEQLENAAAIIVAVLRAMQLEPLIPQQEPTNNVSKDTPALRLLRSCEIDETVLQMSNEQLADVLLNRVWAGMDMTSAESSFVSAAIDRLKLGGVPSEQGTPPQGTCDTTDWPHLMSDGSGKKRLHEKRVSCTNWAASQGTGWVSVEGDEFEEMALTWMRKHFKLVNVWWHGYESPTVSGVTFLRQFLRSDEYRKWALLAPPSGEKT